MKGLLTTCNVTNDLTSSCIKVHTTFLQVFIKFMFIKLRGIPGCQVTAGLSVMLIMLRSDKSEDVDRQGEMTKIAR